MTDSHTRSFDCALDPTCPQRVASSQPADSTATEQQQRDDSGVAGSRSLMAEPEGLPEEPGEAGPGVIRGPDGVEMVPQPHGGMLRRGGMPGNASNGGAVSSIGLKRKARRMVDQLLTEAESLARKGLAPRPDGTTATAAEVKSGLDALRLLSIIAEPTAAEDRRDDPSAPDAPTITVRAGGHAPPAPPPSPPETVPGNRVPSADPIHPHIRPTPNSGEREGAMGLIQAFRVVRGAPADGE